MNTEDPLYATSGLPDTPWLECKACEAKTSLAFTDEPSKQNWTMRDSGPLLSLPSTYTSFHDNSSRVIMTITRDGRLEKGPGLSDDEASVQFFEVCRKMFIEKVKELEDKLAKESARVDWLERHALAQHSTYVSISELGAHFNGFPGSFRGAVDRAMDKKENPQ